MVAWHSGDIGYPLKSAKSGDAIFISSPLYFVRLCDVSGKVMGGKLSRLQRRFFPPLPSGEREHKNGNSYTIKLFGLTNLTQINLLLYYEASLDNIALQLHAGRE
jgi:hypothetical protein